MSADTRPGQRDGRSRRDFFGLTALAAGAQAAAWSGCGGSGPEGPPPEVPNVERDIAILAPVLDQEYAAIAAYEAVIPDLGGSTRRTATQFADQERQHADRLAAVIRRLGSEPRGPRPARAYSSTFPDRGDRKPALGFAVDVEETAIAAYIDALGKLSTASLRSEAAVILTTESEQLSVLLDELGLDPIPNAFVGGRPLPI